MKRNVRKVLAAILSICIILSTETVVPELYYVQAKSTESDQNAALKAYKKKLSKSDITIAGDTYNTANDSFAVADINHDGVPELFMRGNGTQIVYQYKNNSVKTLAAFAAGDMLQCFEKGNILRKGRMLQGYIYEDICRISKGKLKSVASAVYDDTGSLADEFIVNGKKQRKNGMMPT